MPEPELGELLDELRAAIDGSNTLSDDDRTHLGGLVHRVEAAATDEDEGILDHLDDALSRFETDHVDLVSTINRIANALSAGGI